MLDPLGGVVCDDVLWRSLHAAIFKEASHLLTASMNDGDFDALRGELRDLAREIMARTGVIEKRASDFYKGLHSRPAVSGSPSVRFRF